MTPAANSPALKMIGLRAVAPPSSLRYWVALLKSARTPYRRRRHLLGVGGAAPVIALLVVAVAIAAYPELGVQPGLRRPLARANRRFRSGGDSV